MFQPGKNRLFIIFVYLFSYEATVAIDIGAIVMTLIMIYHIKSKYTAVGKFNDFIDLLIIEYLFQGERKW